jgi:ABC-type multidrug transport system fused ATPase/permease subunit
MKFYEPTSGTINVEDIPTSDWEYQALRRNISLVSQEVRRRLKG